jgi:hypothetical protein
MPGLCGVCICESMGVVVACAEDAAKKAGYCASDPCTQAEVEQWASENAHELTGSMKAYAEAISGGGGQSAQVYPVSHGHAWGSCMVRGH